MFRGVDLIMHAGDMHDAAVLDWLEAVAPVIGVPGNGDDGTWPNGGCQTAAGLQPRLSRSTACELG